MLIFKRRKDYCFKVTFKYMNQKNFWSGKKHRLKRYHANQYANG